MTHRHPVLGVGALLQAVADALQARFNPVTVRGEISGFSRASSGHCYFNLKDAGGQLRCALFRRAALLAPIDLADGLLVELTGRLDVYGPRGDLQLVAESVRPAGQGALYEQFLRLKAQLESEGWFEADRKRPLPAWPHSIGVVTSPGAAAWHDVVTALRRRVPHIPVTLYPSLVQGAQAPEALCQALLSAYDRHRRTGESEVLLLVRGGGALEDLWAFNAPELVRTLGQAPMPVICGVGHETDVTLADLVADVRAATPTAAAELCAPAREEALARLQTLGQRAQAAVARGLDRRAQHLDRLTQEWGRPSARLRRADQQLLQLAHRMNRAVGWRLQADSQTIAQHEREWPQRVHRHLQCQAGLLEQAQARLQLLNPAGVLQRGYTWLSDAAGQPIVHCGQIQTGQRVSAALADGVVELSVEATRPGDLSTILGAGLSPPDRI